MKQLLIIAVAGWATAFYSTAAQADDAHAHTGWNGNRADSHAPIGVMGDHTHAAGEWMASYRFMSMEMDGNIDGTSSVSTSEILNQYMVTPLDMTMDMHMLGVMYAPGKATTLFAMVPYVEKSMAHQTRMGNRFITKTSGIGDVKVGALYDLWAVEGHRLHLNVGLGLPTGGIDEKDDTPAGRNVLPYPMQLGSGTYDLMPGLTYLGQNARTSWGAQLIGTYRLDENSNDYALGDRYDVTLWASLVTCANASVSLRLKHTHWEDIEGADASLNPMMIPTADPDLRGGDRTDFGFGINLLGTGGLSSGHRFAAEILWPVRQDLDGPQLETDQSFVLGWQKAF